MISLGVCLVSFPAVFLVSRRSRSRVSNSRDIESPGSSPECTVSKSHLTGKEISGHFGCFLAPSARALTSRGPPV
jgi:hypothetical protein